jgi:hypothetical protein
LISVFAVKFFARDRRAHPFASPDAAVRADVVAVLRPTRIRKPSISADVL